MLFLGRYDFLRVLDFCIFEELFPRADDPVYI